MRNKDRYRHREYSVMFLLTLKKCNIISKAELANTWGEIWIEIDAFKAKS